MTIAMMKGDLSDELQDIRRQIEALQMRAAQIEHMILSESPQFRPGWPIRRISAHQSMGE